METVRLRLGVAALLLMIVSFFIAVALSHPDNVSSPEGLSAASWFQQATFWLGLIATAGAVATWIWDNRPTTGGHHTPFDDEE